MNSQKQLLKLIITKSPQIITLRIKAINGNKQILQSICNTILQLLKDKNNHKYAYHETNQLLLSAHPDIITYIANNVLVEITKYHCMDNLQQYIILWKDIISVDNNNYPNMHKQINQKLDRIKLNNQHKQVSQYFINCKDEFIKNQHQIFDKRIQFFDDTMNNQLNYSNTNTILQYSSMQASSDAIQQNMQQLQQIKLKLQKGSINLQDQSILNTYITKIKQFILLKPKSLKKQLSISFNTDRIWAKQFLSKFNQKHYKLKSSDIHYAYKFKIIENGTKVQNKKQDILQQKNRIGQENIIIPSVQHPITYQIRHGLNKRISQKCPNLSDSSKQLVSSYRLKTQTDIKLHQKQLNKKYSKPSQSQISQQYNTEFSKNCIQRTSNNQIPPNQGFYSQTTPYFSQNFRKMTNIQNNKSNQIISSFYQINKNIEQKNKKLIQSKSQQNLYSSRSRSRPKPKIFNSKKTNKFQDPEQQNLIVTVHNRQSSNKNYDNIRKQYGLNNQSQYKSGNYSARGLDGFTMVPYNPSGRYTFLSDNNSPKNSSQNMKIYDKQKIRNPSLESQKNPYSFFNQNKQIPSPKICYQQKQLSQYINPAFIKLSQYTKQKQQRKLNVINQQIIPLQNYLIQPYTRNFHEYTKFNRFRRNCLSNNSILYCSNVLTITCITKRISDYLVQIQLIYTNKSNKYLTIQTLYRIPKCMKIQKYNTIHKNWLLTQENKHNFGIKLRQFPLQPAILNIRYYPKQDNISKKYPIILSLPITIQNFLNYTVINQHQWQQKYKKWSSQQNYHIYHHILYDRTIIQLDQLYCTLLQFISLTQTEDFSIKQLGAYCLSQSIQNVSFLLRISHRINNILTLELLADREVKQKDLIQYLEYCLNIWCLLLSKVEKNQVQ